MYKILAVDDDEPVLEILCLNLKHAGYDVVTAKNGLEVFDMLNKHPDISLILLDNMMPVMDGIRLLNHIKHEKSPYRHINVILQSAKVQESDVCEGLYSGAINYLKKPYTKDRLLLTVATVLRDSEAVESHAVMRLMS